MNSFEHLNFLDELNNLIFVLSPEMTVQYANRALLEFLDLEAEAILGMPAWELPMWKDSPEAQNDLMFACGHVFSSEEAKRLEMTPVNSLGEIIELDLYIKPVLREGNVVSMIATGYNITELVEAKTVLTKRERQIAAFFKNSTEGYFFQMLPEAALLPQIIDDEFIGQVYEAQRLESVSSRVFEYLGLDEEDVVLGSSEMLMQYFEIREDERTAVWREMLEKGVSILKRELLNRKSRKRVYLELKFVGVFIDACTFEGNFCIVSNITQQYVYERELNFLANKDPLTGLNNRRCFDQLANDMLTSMKTPFVAAMMDIDKFKNVNDAYGHEVGDIVIRKVADVINAVVPECGVVGRYGGEEFVILMACDAKQAVGVLEEIRKTVENAQIHYGSGYLKVTISGGAHIFEEAGNSDFNHAIILADRALYEAKETGRNRVIVYNDALHGLQAIDKLTGVYTQSAFQYKHNLFHDNLRKFEIAYGIVAINLNTLLDDKSELRSQFIKQCVAILHDLLRDTDIIGRYDTMTFTILLSNVNDEIVEKVGRRISSAIDNLSSKFDNLLDGRVKYYTVSNWMVQQEEIYDHILNP